jgi:hypothetical protein
MNTAGKIAFADSASELHPPRSVGIFTLLAISRERSESRDPRTTRFPVRANIAARRTPMRPVPSTPKSASPALNSSISCSFTNPRNGAPATLTNRSATNESAALVHNCSLWVFGIGT